MGLYLCVFDDDEDVEGIDCGGYSDWNAFIAAVVEHVEQGRRGTRVPLLTMHSDSDGEWSPAECVVLERALDEIEAVFARRPAEPPRDGWRAQVAEELELQFDSLRDCFFDVDGENLIERLRGLAKLARDLDRPIRFQ
jgi:hypothetical protein